ncbi:hypothetical protein BP6252_01722 [Coleophoma cylindrospora]|uniref:Uncharacterized protein n=1 Tax=Coleophoma cylindrospora TaxID=1849047 RepID=A0A3D8STP5_9HELO|nr:hypothetical protein BP6252_01722 [Coleophoma cylindrospora]
MSGQPEYVAKTAGSNSSQDDFEKVVGDAKMGVTEISAEDHHDFIGTLKETLAEHSLDPNFPADILERARNILNDDTENISPEQARRLMEEIEVEKQYLLNDSPYAEVRAVVDNTDDPDTPVNTFRAWFLGTICVIIGTGLDQFFSLRQPGIWIYSFVAQLLSFPVGVAMAKYLPTKSVSLFGYSFSLNPGPFNQKEHILITVMSNVAYGGYNGTAYVTYIFQVLKLDMFYGEKTLANSAGFQILLALSTQLIGYGCAGLTRRFLVYPSVMIWPKNLATIALNKALHNDNGKINVNGWTISRYRFFLYTFCGMFVYYWFPDYIFQALSYFNWITWIAPSNLKLAIITGSVCGLGLNPWTTFDWNVASYLYDPIITPWFSVANAAVGMAIVGFIFAPAMYFNNVWQGAYFPINSNDVFDNTGSSYNVSRVLNADFTLNVESYEAYSSPYLSTMNSLLYSTFFAIYLATIVYVFLYHGKELKTGFMSAIRWTNARDEHKDVHNRLMRQYKECPEWWYLAILAISFIIACVVCTHWKTDMPIWGIIFAVALCFFLQVPIGMIQAVTNIEVTNNVIAEFVAGYALPGKPIANMIFKSYGYIASAQSVQFASDLKLGHYLKVPPRTMFIAQTYATIWGALVSIGVNAWQLENIAGICESDQSAKFTCPGSHTFFTASVIWGAIGPKRMYGAGRIYNPLEWGFLVGALLPVPFYFLSKRYPSSWVKYIHIPVILYGPLWWAPYNWSYMQPCLIAAFIFNYYIKRRYLDWWQRYAYVLTSSLAVGLSISAIIIFFAVEYHAVNINWWGNNVPYAGVDGGGIGTCTLLQVPEGGHF